MKFSKVLEERRSIRKYSDKPVEKEQVKKILKAALMAPSWKNTETARYYVIMDNEMLAQVKENCLPGFNAKNVEFAPVLIVETFVKNISGTGKDGEFVNEGQNGWGWYDLGLASENLVLAAQAEGLGTLIMGMYNEAGLRKILSIPEEEILGPVISLGYPNIEPKAPKRQKISDVAKFF